MEFVDYLIQILTAVVILGVGVILRNLFPAYLKEKGKNLATKEDIEEITQRIEGVKHSNAKSLEEFKGDIWFQQQKISWKKEEFILKIELFKKAIEVTNKYQDQLLNHQILLSSRDIALAITEAELPLTIEGRQYYRNEYEDYRKKTADSYIACRETGREISVVAGTLSVFFPKEISELLLAVRDAGKPALNYSMKKNEIHEILLSNFQATQDLDLAKNLTGEAYDQRYRIPNKEAAHFLETIRLIVATESTPYQNRS